MTPTLATAPPMQLPSSATAGKPGKLFFSLMALLLIGIGVAIGWLRPWHAEPAAPMPILATKPTEPAAPQVIPMSPVTVSAPELKPAPIAPRPVSPVAMVPVATPATPVLKAIPPVANRQAVPNITITVHSYSPDPAERMAGINGRMLHEGEEVEPGLKLEKITADAVLLNFKGQRFRREVH